MRCASGAVQEGRQRDERVCYLPLHLFPSFFVLTLLIFQVFVYFSRILFVLILFFLCYIFSASFFVKLFLYFCFPLCVSSRTLRCAKISSSSRASFLPSHLISSHRIPSSGTPNQLDCRFKCSSRTPLRFGFCHCHTHATFKSFSSHAAPSPPPLSPQYCCSTFNFNTFSFPRENHRH